jgi:hypothetical protein
MQSREMRHIASMIVELDGGMFDPIYLPRSGYPPAAI